MKAEVESAKEVANLLSDEILKVYNAGNKVESIKEEISGKVRGVRSVNVRSQKKLRGL